MARDIRLVVADIDALPTVDGTDLDCLQVLADEYFASPAAASHLDVWFRLYERFPDDHGHGVFWTILHGIEGQPGNAAAVVVSVGRRPSHYPVLMVNRMLNAGIASAGRIDLLDLLRGVAEDEWWPAAVREEATRYLEHQGRRG